MTSAKSQFGFKDKLFDLAVNYRSRSFLGNIWNRLTAASATNGSWGEQYTFDNFGNLTGKTPTAGTAPAMNVPANLATNQPAGSYDANGNPQGNSNYPPAPGYLWDGENRLATDQTAFDTPISYSYDPWGRRVWKQGADYNNIPYTGEFYFYGVTGQKLETYSFTHNVNVNPVFNPSLEGINIYFGRKLLQSKGVWVATDRLGSVRATSNQEAMSYWPYGEERDSTANGREKFATYTRDGVGQDYAVARYYNSSTGAFWTPDPGGIRTANPKNPSSWNRYPYVSSDPVNHTDPTGMEQELCGPDWLSDPSLEGPCCDPSNQLLGAPLDPACYAGVGGGDTVSAEAPPPPTCAVSIEYRPISGYPLADHGYLDFTSSDGTDIIEGYRNPSNYLKVSIGPTGLPADNPSGDSVAGSISGAFVCNWLSTLESDQSNVNAAGIVYNKRGPNSNSVLAYLLSTLPSTNPSTGLSWYSLPGTGTIPIPIFLGGGISITLKLPYGLVGINVPLPGVGN